MSSTIARRSARASASTRETSPTRRPDVTAPRPSKGCDLDVRRSIVDSFTVPPGVVPLHAVERAPISDGGEPPGEGQQRIAGDVADHDIVAARARGALPGRPKQRRVDLRVATADAYRRGHDESD